MSIRVLTTITVLCVAPALAQAAPIHAASRRSTASGMEALFAEVRAFEVKLFTKEPHAGKVGAFEGANYEATGFFRPEVDCIMFTRSETFCAVCTRAMETVIALYT